MNVSVRFSSVSPTSLASSISFSSVRRDIAFGYVCAALQPPGFAFQRLQPLDRAAHFVDQSLFLKRIEIDVANSDGNLHARPRHVPLRADVRPFLRLQCFI